ncbi:helix-hairpin-helix domain-containing protein [Roseivirga sp.]|uniref:helix-hairpin-helix domain-containing protein n=1 Tax=Roseivirga sp. TaxID=1964215 RepID=UPI003B8DDEC2
MKLKKLIQEWFGFTKAEINGIVILIPLIAFFVLMPTLYRQFFGIDYNTGESDKRLLDSLLLEIQAGFKKEVEPVQKPLELFNPNTYPVADLIAIGVPTFLSKRIENFRSKGGSFRVKSDLLKIYDFPDSLYDRLKGYIDLPITSQNHRTEKATKSSSKPLLPRNADPVKSSPSIVSKRSLRIFDLNEADTTQLKMIKGIGSSYAKRIVGYRNLLGGYHTVDQLKEIYGMSEELYQSIVGQFKVQDQPGLKKLQINIATFKELLAHPYIDYELTKEILNMKSSRGKFSNLEDLYLLTLIDSAGVKKLAPYLIF